MIAVSNILNSDMELQSILSKVETDDTIQSFFDYKAVDDKISKSFNAALISYQADIVI